MKSKKRLISELNTFFNTEENKTVVPPIEEIRAYNSFDKIHGSIEQDRAPAKRRINTRRAVLMAACFVVCAALVAVPLSVGSPANDPVSVLPSSSSGDATETTVSQVLVNTTEQTVSIADTTDVSGSVIWSNGTIRPGLETDLRTAVLFENSSGETSEDKYTKKVSDKIYLRKPYYDYSSDTKFDFYDQFMNADDDALFALNVQVRFTAKERDLISAECGFDEVEEAKKKVGDTQDKIAGELKKSLDINTFLAYMKAKTDPEYIGALNDYYETGCGYIKNRLRFETEIKKEALDFLFEKCDSILFDGNTENENEAVYLSNTASLAVIIISKGRIKELESGDNTYFFTSASENYENAGLSKKFSQNKEIMPDDGKITYAAKEEFENASGDPLNVKIYYSLRDREPDEFDAKYGSPDDDYEARWNRVLAKYGMTREEYFNSNNIDAETVKKIQDDMHEYLNRTKETADLLDSVFLDGEMISYDRVNGCVTACITYDRALEIEKTWEIAVICVPGEDVIPYGVPSFVNYSFEDSADYQIVAE